MDGQTKSKRRQRQMSGIDYLGILCEGRNWVKRNHIYKVYSVPVKAIPEVCVVDIHSGPKDEYKIKKTCSMGRAARRADSVVYSEE